MRLLFRDFQFGARMLAKNPMFTLATILTLALGIGANTAIFTVADALLLRPFPYADPARLVSVEAKDNSKDFNCTLLRYEMVRDLNRSFSSVAAWTSDNLNLTGNGETLQVPVARVSPSFFSLLGVQPQLGRAFGQNEGTPEGKPVVILSAPIWRTRFHADRNVVGQPIMLDSTAYIVVGVLPDGAQFPFMPTADIFTPRYFEYSLITPQHLRMGVGYLNMVARLRPGATLSSANTELSLLNRHYREQNPTAPDAGSSIAMTAASLRDAVVGNVRPKVLMLSAAVAVILLIACANVASLLLSRALARKREIAVRAALGASRGTIMRQLLTESMMLAFIAGALGAGLSWVATHALANWGANQLPQGFPIGVDRNVLLFTVSISGFAGIMFGIVPALQLARVDLNATLRDEGRGASMGRTRARMKDLLVVGQIALSLLLVIGAGLLLRSFERLLHVDPGFDFHNLLTMNISLSTVKYGKPGQQIAFFDDVLNRVSTQPGVRSAAISAALPLSWKRITPVLPEGHADVPLAQRPFIDIEAVSPKWFETMHVPLRNGRSFTDADNAVAPPVIIVNQTFARQFWPNQDAVNKKVIIGRRSLPAIVIGVAADVKNRGLEQETQAQLYLPFPQLPWSDMNLLVRTDVPPQTAIATVRAQVSAVDREQPVVNIQTVDDLMDGSRAQPRFIMMLGSVFSATALVLAIIGIYGVLSYSVAQRQQEFGIRLALGADRADLLKLVLRQGLVLAVVGISIGITASLLLTRLVSSMLYKVGARDLTTFVVAPLIFLLIAAIASYLPARRATRVDPIKAMR
jgi:putative ABC transport system permease protein